MPDEQKPQPPEKPQAPPAKPAPKPKPPAEMVTEPWEGELPDLLKARFGDAISQFATYVGQSFLVTTAASVVTVVEFLRDECGFDYLVDVTAADWPKREARFDVVYILYSFSRNVRIRVKIQVKDGERAAHGDRRPPHRELAGAGGLRYVRHRVRRPSGHEAHSDARRLERIPSAQGLLDSADGRAMGSREPGH